MSDYWNKKMKLLQEEEEKKKLQETPSGYWEQKSAELKAQTTASAAEDIAPVKETEDKKWYQGWFQKGAFEDGYQLGDISKTIIGTLKDTETNVVAGVLGMGEKIVDAGAYVAGAVGEAFGADEFADKTKDFIEKDLYDEKAIAKKLASANVAGYLASTVSDFDEDSVLDDKTDSVLQSAGQLAATAGLQAVGVPWFLTTGVTSFGGATEEAFSEDATFAEAGGSALISAGAEILSEKLFGGIKFGGKTLDDVLLQPLVNKISHKVGRTLVNMGIDAVGEGSEEVISSVFHNLGTALYKEESIDELLTSEETMDEYIQSFIGGMGLGGGMGSVNAANSIKTGRDYKTGLTDNEQKVIDKEIENRIAEQEADGKKLTSKEKSAIEEAVKSDLEKGYISIDTIESAIGGETYDNYKSLTEHEENIKNEIETLENLPDNQISVKQREQLKALRDELKALEDNSTVSQFKDRLSAEVSELAKSDRLVESYNERTRRGQAFEADLSKYSEKQRATVQRAIDSGVLNNTNRSHELVDLVAKLEEDKALPFDFTNNEKLKETGFALNGKTVNGYVTKDGVALNVNSKKALNSVVGHEITHVLEGTELYGELQQAVKDFAVAKGEYDARYESLAELYKGIEGANIEAELTADLIGDYLFTDSDFINKLSTEKPNIFKKVYDEIKYLYKIATAGSKEARELERVKRAFEEAYRADGKGVSGTKYAIQDNVVDQNGTKYDHVVELEYDTFNKVKRSGKAYIDFVRNNLIKQKITVYGSDGTAEVVEFAGEKERVKKDGANRDHLVIGELTQAKNELKKLVILNATETAEISNFANHSNEHSHQWLDVNGWDERTSYVMTKDGTIYPVTLHIAKARDGRNILYDVNVKIKEGVAADEIATSSLAEELKKQAVRSTTPSDAGSLTQGGENVKTQFSLSADSEGRTLSPATSKRFENSKVVDENGSLKVVYHGTASGEFSIFDKAKGNVEGDYGSGFYFTDSEYDVSEHYEDGGPDFEIKVGRRADEIYNEEPDIEYEEAEERARKELYKGGHKFEVYLNIENPAIVGETILLDSESYYSEYNQEDYDSEEDYEGEVEQLIADDIDGIIWDVENNVDVYSTDGLADVLWNAVSEGGIGLEELKKRINDLYLENSNGELVGNEVARQVIESLGYDGIIDPTVSTKWNMEMEDGTTHYIVFKPNQIKAVTNQNPTDNPDIHRSLSANGATPQRYGNYNIFGEDVAYNPAQTDMQDEAEELAPSQAVANNATTTEESSAIRSETEQVETAEEAPAAEAENTSSFPKWADNEIKSYKRDIAEERAKAKDNRKPSLSALKRLAVTKPKGDAKNHGVLTSDGKQYISYNAFAVAEMNDPDKSIVENEALAVEGIKKFIATANNNVVEDGFKIDPIDISLIRKHVLKDNRAVVIVGESCYDIRLVDAVLKAIENPDISLSAFRSGFNLLLIKGENGQAIIAPVNHKQNGGRDNHYVYKADKISGKQIAPESITPTTAEDATAARVESMANINDADAPQEVEAPYYEAENSATPTDPFTDRDYKAVGNRKVKAYMYENPEVRPFFQEAAQAMLGDLQNSTKGERMYNDDVYYESGGEQGWGGTERHTTEDIAYLLDKGYTYAEIEKGLNAIIEDNGAENIAIAKRIEFALNDRLRQGYTDIYGNQIPRNQEYLNILSQKQAAEIASEEAPLPSDADAPAEDIAPYAPVEQAAPAPAAERYEAIKPRPQQQAQAEPAEPRMARADKPKDPRGELRSWAETSTESEVLKGIVNIEQLNQDLIHYQPISNKKSLASANEMLEKMGYEEAVKYFEGRFNSRDANLNDVVLGERLIQEAAKRGDIETAMNLDADVSILGTEHGQIVQALSIIQRLTPEGQLRMLQRVIKRGKTNGDKAFEGVELTEEQARSILETRNPDGTYDQAELNAVVEEVKQQVADQMNTTFGEKINAWRYLAMLGNPKTHIRNIVSNIAMKGTAAVKNAIARTVEDIIYPEPTLWDAAEKQKAQKAQMIQKAADSIIPNGTIVKAADRDNIGTVQSYDAATGKYAVHFVSKSGHTATVKLDANVIKPLNPIKSKAADGTAADSTTDDIAPTRTKTWRRATAEVKEYAKQVTAEMESVLSGESKYSAKGSIKAKRNIFGNKLLDSANNANNYLLSEEDMRFKRSAFESSFREFLTANGIKTKADIENSPELVAKGKKYAEAQALIATFQQESWLANKIHEIESKNPALGVAVGAVMPFKKTPINIAKTGLMYSPLGFAKSAYDAAQVRKGEMDASTLIDHLAQNVTGSVLTMAGYLLAKSGMLTGAGDDDKEGKYDYQLGKQGYSLKIGDQTFTLSWLTPVSMPLFVGANAYEQLVEDKGWSGDVVMDTLAQTLDPLSEMSFLSGLDTVLSSYDSGIQKFMGIGESMIQNYATQFVPTLSSQIAAISDDKKRTSQVAANSNFRFLDETVNKIKYKIPGLRQTLEPSTDIWGNEVKQSDNLITRAFENAIAPYARKEDISTEIDEEIKGLYRETGEDGLIPSIPKNYLNYKNEKYEMSAGEYTAYKKTYGQTANSMLEALFETSTYRSASAEERADMVDDVYDYARDVASREYFSGKDVEYTNATEEGKEYYRDNFIKGAIENDVTVEEYGFSYNNPEKYKFLKNIGVSYDEYSASDESKEAYSWAYNNPEKYTLSKAVASDVITYRKYTGELYDIKADKDSSGKTITGSRKEKVIDYINDLDADYGEKIILFKSEYNADDTYNQDIIDYLNERDDISYEEMETILKELGFNVRADGTIWWD